MGMNTYKNAPAGRVLKSDTVVAKNYLSEADIKKLSTEGFMIGFGDEIINHSSKFTVVDRKGNLRGFYTGTEPEEIDRLRADINTLRRL